MKPLSEDLRQRIVRAREAGEGTGEVCRRFGVSRSSAERFWNQYRRRGHCRRNKSAAAAAPGWRSMSARCGRGSRRSPT